MDKLSYLGLIQGGVNRLVHRDQLVEATLENPGYIDQLLELIGNTNTKEANHAARLLELVVKNQGDIILDPIDRFIELLPRIHQDPSIRASAKIIEICCFEYFIKEQQEFQEVLNSSRLARFTEVSFDWMLADKAIAIQAHSMYSLYLLGRTFNWIHPELVLHINRKLAYGSAGFQNRGKKILKAIETKKLLKLY